MSGETLRIVDSLTLRARVETPRCWRRRGMGFVLRVPPALERGEP